MRRFRSTYRNIAVVAAALLMMTIAAAGAQAAAPADWADCRAGYSCYFTHADGGTPMWVAPSPGCFDLGRMNPPFNDRISSVWNRGGGYVDMYNWTGSAWDWVDGVAVGQSVSYGAGDWRNDIIDRVCI